MGQESGEVTQPKQPLGVATLLLWGGMGIAFLGAVFFIAQYFDDWVEAAELLVALGIGIPFTYLGIRAERQRPGTSSTTLWLLFGLPCLFSGIGLLAKMIFGHHGDVGTMTLTLLYTAIALGLYAMIERNVAMFLALLTGSAAYFKVLNVTLGHAPTSEIECYRVLILGAVWGALAWMFSGTKREALVNFMLSAAGILVFSSMLWLAQQDGRVGNAWEVASVLLAGTVFLTSPKTGRYALLWIGGIALLVNILEITYRHFSDSLGWSLSLVVTGLVISGLGALLMWMRGEYFRKNP